MTDFALCVTCPEITTGRSDSSKGFLLDASSNHNNCEVIPLDMRKLDGPMRIVTMKLGAGVPITNMDISMFKLGYEMSDKWRPKESLSTAPDVASRSEGSPAAVPALDASMKSPPVSEATLTTRASGEGMLW